MRDRTKTKEQLIAEIGHMREELIRLRKRESGRKRAERRRRESEAKYSILVEHSRAGVAIVQNDTFRFCNPALSRILGYSVEEMAGMSFADAFAPESRDRALEIAGHAGTTEVKHGFHDIRMRQKDGSQREVQMAIEPVTFNGKPASILVVRDTSEDRATQMALQESRELFRRIFADSPIAIQLCDTNGKFIDMNRACLEMFGMSRITDYHHQWRGIFDGPFMPDEDKNGLRAGHTVRFEVTFNFDSAREVGVYKGTKTGTSLYDVIVSPLGLDTVHPSGYIFQMQDITERKRAEEALTQSEELFRRLYEESPIAIQLCDPDGQFVRMNRASLEMFDIGALGEFAWRGIFQGNYMPKKQQDRLRRGEVIRYEVAIDFNDIRNRGLNRGTREGVAYYDVLVNPLGRDHGTVTGYLSHIQDITDRKRAEKELRDLSRRLVEVQEIERRHIARELHDEIGQALTGLNILLEMGVRQAGESARPRLTEAKKLTDDLMRRVGDLSLSLRPSMLDDLGLLPTLVWHFERYTVQTGIRVMFEQQGLQRRFPPEMETAVYRMVQEALTNVARYAGVQEVTVRLLADAESLIVQVEDHGKGFDAEAALASGESSGLVGMRERAIALGGQLFLNSIPGSGTRLLAEFLLEDPGERTDAAP